MDLEPHFVLRPRGNARHLGKSKGAVAHLHQRGDRILHFHLSHLLRIFRHGAFLEKRLHHHGDLLHFADEVPHDIEDMGTEIDQHATANHLFLKPPFAGALRIDIAGMEIETAEVKHPTDKIGIDEFFCFHDRGDEAVLRRDLMLHPGLVRNGYDFACFRFVEGQRLLAIDMLSVLQGRDHRVLVQSVGSADVHDINVLALHERTVVGCRRFKTCLFDPFPRQCLIRITNTFQRDLTRLAIIVQGNRPVGVCMNAPHLAISYHPDTNLFLHTIPVYCLVSFDGLRGDLAPSTVTF